MGNWSDYILKLFQSTLPRRERLPIKSLIPYSFKFQSTLPRRERQLLPKFLTNFQYFNPHSHEGSDTTPGVKDSKLAKFQSTLPRRERQQMERYTRQKHKISIHTPTKGATAVKTVVTTVWNDFNPHSHEGSDSRLWKNIRDQCNFNPHSHEGSDWQARGSRRLYNHFNPHSHEGSDLAAVATSIYANAFQSTLPRRERRI